MDIIFINIIASPVKSTRKAGGKVTDLEGNEFDINSEDLLASNERIHDRLLELIQFRSVNLLGLQSQFIYFTASLTLLALIYNDLQ